MAEFRLIILQLAVSCLNYQLCVNGFYLLRIQLKSKAAHKVPSSLLLTFLRWAAEITL